MSESVKVLFVCMGNICRSPAGEAVLQSYVVSKGLEKYVVCDSAGTLREHVGEKADPRMIRVARARGYDVTSRARQFKPDDFDRFDYIIVMDRMIQEMVFTQARSPRDHLKVLLMGDYYPEHDVVDVPDPYYGRSEGFELVLDILEVACGQFLDHIIARHDLKPGG